MRNLREIRTSKKISAMDMATALGLKTEAAYYKKESGSIRITIDEAKIIADKLGERIELVFFSDELSTTESDKFKNPKAS